MKQPPKVSPVCQNCDYYEAERRMSKIVEGEIQIADQGYCLVNPPQNHMMVMMKAGMDGQPQPDPRFISINPTVKGSRRACKLFRPVNPNIHQPSDKEQ